MVSIISYNKQTWNEYNDSQTADKNLANGAIISADRLNHMETGISNNDTNKVTDNKNGTEQLNGVQVQPFNKLSDTIGGRNLLINTAQLNDSTVCLDHKSNTSDTYLGLNIYQTTGQWNGVKIYLSYLASKIKTDTDYVMSEYVRNTSPTTSVPIDMFGNNTTGAVFNSPINYNVVTLPPNSGWTRISALVNIASFSTPINGPVRFEASNATALTDGYVQFAGLKFEQGTIATDWTPAPEDKVNVSDMRKPASDVAGIEEVSTLQTQVDNSAVGTNLLINSNFSDESLAYWTVDTGVTSSFDSNGNLVLTVVNATANNRIYYSNQILDAGTTYAISFYAYVDSSSTSSSINVKVGPYQNLTSISVSGNTLTRYTGILNPVSGNSGTLTIAIGTFNSGTVGDIVHITRIKLEKGSVATDWCANPTEILTKADDSKVAHLSGANNFDTVPTYGTNNKPFAINDTGATTARPTGQAVGYQYFDTTLNKPIWYNGSKWVDSTGKTV